MLHGTITALVTPFCEDQIDFTSLAKLLDYQIAHQVDGIVIAGSTGELSTLSFEEYKQLVSFTVQHVKKRIPIIAGCGLNNTKLMLELARIAEGMGVDGLMCNVPYYNNPTQEGIYQHFKLLHDGTHLPIILYSVPSRTKIDFQDETILRLAELPRVKALKDASGDLERPLRLRAKFGSKLKLLAGDDARLLAFCAQGGDGIISVASNLVPHLIKQLIQYFQAGKNAQALALHTELYPLYQQLGIESNPIPIKYALSTIGLCQPIVRLPLTSLSTTYHQPLEAIVQKISQSPNQLVL